MANTKVTQHVIANNAITADQLASAAVTDAKLHSTLDLSGKTLTLPATAIPSASTATTQAASDNSTKLATTAYVTTAIANLNDSAPTALNTLNELAAALGDDANFSATITTALAAKAPLANPTFTGSISHASDLILDVGGDIILDADGGDIVFKDAGSSKLFISNSSDDVLFTNGVQDKDLIFKGYDGTSLIAALTLDMSEAGFATFNSGGAFGGTGALRVPQGTTGQRPSAATGQIRWNTTDGALEVYNGTAWTAVGTGSSNKVLDTFTGNGSNRTFTLSVTPANEDAIMVFIDGAYQEKSDYVLTNNSLVLDTAPLNNEKIAVHITTAAVHDGTSAVNQQFTATAGQTDFTLSQDPSSENNTQVYINGVYQQKTDYTVTGTTLAFDTGLTVGDVVEVNMFTVATLGNTDTVTEGVSNLYHTTARARGAISVSGNAISYNSSTGVLTANFEESPTFTGTLTSSHIISTSNTATQFKNATDSDIQHKFETNNSSDYALHRLIGSDGADNKFIIGYGPTHGSTPNHLALKNTHASGAIGFYTGGSSVNALTIDNSQISTFNGHVVATKNTGGPSIHISSTRPTLGFTDTNSFSDSNDIYIIRAGGDNFIGQWYDDSAGTFSETFNIDSSGNATFDGAIYSNSGSGTLQISGDSNANSYITSTGQIRFRPEGTSVNKIILDSSYLYAPAFSTTNGTSGIGVSPGDTNSGELGPGYLTLARDDTADADQIKFFKNGNLHSRIKTLNNVLEIYNEGTDLHLRTNMANSNAERSINFNSTSFKPYDSNTGDIDLGSSSGRWRDAYISGGIYFPAASRINSAVSNNNYLDDYEEGTWTPTIAHNDGSGAIPFTLSGSYYVKIGSLVYVRAYMTSVNPNGNAGTSSPYYGIRGFPFQPNGYGSWMLVYAGSSVTSYGGYSSSASFYFNKETGSAQHGQAHVSGSHLNTWGSGYSLMMSAVYNVG